MQVRPKNPSIDWRERITFEPGKRSGQPCIRHMRITVIDVLEYLAADQRRRSRYVMIDT